MPKKKSTEYFDPILDKITFRTISYNKNIDLFSKHESFLTEFEGTVNLIRIDENKPPIQVGEYSLTQLNFDTAKKFNADLKSYLLNQYREDCYKDLIQLIRDNKIDVESYNKIYLISNLILLPEYRKLGITEEFIEYIYRNFYSVDNKILALFKPLQLKQDDFKYFLNDRFVDVKIQLKDRAYQAVPAREYYSLVKLFNYDDMEICQYKLFALAGKCGFNRIEESYIFQFEPNKIETRLKNKIKNNDVELKK